MLLRFGLPRGDCGVKNVCRILPTGWFMSANTEAHVSGRWPGSDEAIVAAILLIVAIVATVPLSRLRCCCRALAVVTDCCSGCGVALLTTKGALNCCFAREARTEVRKVIWPTRRETLHTTLIVAAVTAVMSLILWGLDGILGRPVSFITGLSTMLRST